MSRLQELMNNRKNDSDKLRQAVESLEKKFEREEDKRFWQPTLDETDKASAIIRFLPKPPGEDHTFVTVYSYGWQGPGGWYIENSLTTLKQKDPAQEMLNKLWTQGTEEAKALARARGRKVWFYSNILVIKDPSKPENEGKTFLFRYGRKIMEKIKTLQFPEFGEDPINPFDIVDGCNFRIKISTNVINGKKMRNWDLCSFDSQKSLLDILSEEQIESVLNSEHSLQQFIDPSQFKTYEELNNRLNKALGNGEEEPLFMKEGLPKTDKEDDKFIEEITKPKPKPKDKAPEEKKATPPEARTDDDDLSFFDNLITDD